MENALNEPAPKKNYDFIDHIRCIAMLSIVVEHTAGAYVTPIHNPNYPAYILLAQFFKYGTIIFFLLSGFLISEKFTAYTPGQYLKRRFSSTFGPWLFWSLIYLLCFIVHTHVMERLYHKHLLSWAAFLHEVRNTYLFTNYWFIINFMVSITILLIFRKYLYNKIFGGVLLLFTLFYSVNIHFEWVSPMHTTAILGFVFFLWLGAQLRKHWLIIENQIVMIPYVLLFAALVITFALSIGETVVLTHEHSMDTTNTLRFSNILFSLVFFALLLKIGTVGFIEYLKPRQTTYGIYLIHYIFVIYLLPEVLNPLHIDANNLSVVPYLAVKLCSATAIYLLTLFLVLLINRTPAKRIIGT